MIDEVFSILLFTSAVLFIPLLLLCGASSMACSSYGEASGYETEYIFLSGCYVHTDKGLLSRKALESRLISSEGLEAIAEKL